MKNKNVNTMLKKYIKRKREMLLYFLVPLGFYFYLIYTNIYITLLNNSHTEYAFDVLSPYI